MNTLMALLGGGALTTIVLGLIDRIRNRKFDRLKQGTSVKLDEAQYAEITSRAEQTSSSNLMAVGAFWQGQFTEIEKRLAAEQDWRARVTVKLKEHERWDVRLMKLLEECGMQIEPPPSLNPDDDPPPDTDV